ncbi:HNH endonuclease signature motif containing protein [Blastococcus saxobsidens]|uniref:HNH endonuclease n=1 Tax=Blastococcus saxobsidens (strain DD2) TaxID=1146883 RepID=H6RUL7_BLASD|nr:HNH endonuclease signature motif containing protein [Blastococcus saxobsidens]CCG03184.1 HNH endonuclease [Blastococcus saxobsidens DD2]
MSSGVGFAVGVTVVPVDQAPLPWEIDDPDPVRWAEPLGARLPAHRSAAEVAVLLQQIAVAEAQLAALRLELVMDLAAARPAPGDPRPGGERAGEVRPAGTSEFVADELAMVLNCSWTAAVTLLGQSETLTTRLPATHVALRVGELDWPRARAIAEELRATAPEADPAVVEAVEAAVLPGAAESSVRRLREAVRRELLARDAEAADRRRERARRGADVTVRPVGDGMSLLAMLLPQQDARACRNAVDQHAPTAKDAGDPRPIGMLRAGAAADLMLRPWDDNRPAVTAQLTVVAPLEALTVGAFLDKGATLPAAFVAPGALAHTGEVDGEPITAAHVRELLEQLDAICPGGLQAPTGGSLDIAITDATGALLAVTGRTELQRLARRGCPDHPDTGCGCPLLARPGAVDRYRPSAARQRFLRVRDRTCRHPGCSVRAGWADLDHVIAHADGGPTSCENLCCRCRRHHRLKTFAPGWRHAMTPDGVLTVITPSGVTRISRPPGFHVLTGPPAPPPPEPALADDPPPF